MIFPRTTESTSTLVTDIFYPTPRKAMLWGNWSLALKWNNVALVYLVTMWLQVTTYLNLNFLICKMVTISYGNNIITV
jgi:hypothetical protein